MKNSVYIIFVIAFSIFSVKGYAGGCAPATTTGTCATAVNLTPGAGCVAGTTCGGGAADGNSACIGAGYECEWYSFVATATSMFVSSDQTANSGCFSRSEVFSGGCGALASLSCISGTATAIHSLTLTIGNTYFIQNCYSPGGPCGNGGSASHCTLVDEPSPPCNTCAAPCGTAQGFATAPTVATVVAGCTAADFVPELQPLSTNTFCNTFIAINTSVSFNVIITSNCGGGNVTNFSWSLFNSPACGAAIQTGTLASLTFNGLTINNTYTFCYTFDVPNGCTHTTHCPYFVGSAPLPIELTSFTAEIIDNAFINLNWVTKTEINNDFFTIEKSLNAQIFEVVGIVDGAGNSLTTQNYHLKDDSPYKGTSYYRLAQTDYDGITVKSDIVSVTVQSIFGDLNVYPNPVEGVGYLSFNSTTDDISEIVIYDVTGKKVITKQFDVVKGNNKFKLPTQNLPQGMYFITVGNDKEIANLKFIKE
jgi:hypothetical protein